MIKSSAFPPEIIQNQISQSHQLLKKPDIKFGDIKIRDFQSDDLQQIQRLHRQWFPIQYGKTFFNKIIKGIVMCKIAYCLITFSQGKSQIQKNIIVGIVVFQQSDQVNHIAKQSWKEYIVTTNKSLYIMTLGVIDEFRRKGVATILLNQVKQYANFNMKIKYISLHVVSYNSAANFYEKNGFLQVKYLKKYYDIFRIQYDAKQFVLYVNGGEKKKGWIQWLKSFVHKT